MCIIKTFNIYKIVYDLKIFIESFSLFLEWHSLSTQPALLLVNLFILSSFAYSVCANIN